jgi:plastocyanin
MFNLLKDSKVINAFHVLFVAPLIYAIGTNKLPEEYKKFLIPLAIVMGLYHLLKLVYALKIDKKVKVLLEGMEGNNCKAVHNIKMFDSSPGYDHPILNVKVGECIVWTNVGELDHTVTSAEDDITTNHDGLFNSGYLKPGESFGVQFQSPGSYSYFCVMHKGWMRGRVNVE